MIMRRLPEINALGFPVHLAPPQIMIARPSIEDPKERLNGTLITCSCSSWYRFYPRHDVRENRVVATSRPLPPI